MPEIRRKTPIVMWDGPKDDLFGGMGYTKFSNRLLYHIITELSKENVDRGADQLKTMLVLISVAGCGFELHKSVALARTGLCQTSYYRARQALEKRGWITIDKVNNTIIVNLSVLEKEVEEVEENLPEVEKIEVDTKLEVKDGEFSF